MDTSSYLRSQGWLGTGHALNSHKPGLGLEAGQRTPGLSKPLTIPQKQNVFGVGKKKHDSHADQWWARAFDDVLKGVNAGPEGQKTPVEQQQPPRTNMISMRMGGLGKHGNLYGNFVRGEGLRGTFLKAEEEKQEEEEEEEDVAMVLGTDRVTTVQVDKSRKRRRQDGVDEDVPAGKKICKEELAASGKQEAGQMHASKMAVQESSISMANGSTAGSSREQRRQQRQQQEARKAKELADAQHAPSIAVEEPIKVNGDSKETKEERRQRRKERGERKAAEAAGVQTALESAREEPVSLIQEGTETKAQRKQRREERRARKAAKTAQPQIALKSPAEEPASRDESGSGTKEERRQRREERRARKATERPRKAVHQAVESVMPKEHLENGKANNVMPDSQTIKESAMADEPSTVASKREKKARDEKKKKKREQKALG